MATTSLRAVTHRLTTTPVQQLPPIASFLATSLSDCGELLSAPQNQKTGKSDSDNAVQIHKLKTRLGSLLQDRTFEGRWTGVVLVKATVEAGQWEVLRGCEPLVRSLIAILAKPDPVTTKKMCIITLTRIFHLTYQYPTLVREITTPSLPSFITSILNLVSVKPSSEPIRKLRPSTPFLEIVLYAILELIARHPTIFRPFSAQIHSLLQAIIGSTSPTYPEPVVELAQRLFISLHNCAPKNSSGEEWRNATMFTISSIHRTSDYVFRGIIEQWESVDPNLRQAAAPQDYTQEAGDDGPDPLGLSGWRGIHSGVDRILALLRLLSTFFSTPTASAVSIPMGQILDLTSRLTSVIVPTESGDVQANPQISREERESLWTELPRIHTACMKLLQSAVNALETGTLSVAQTILEQGAWVFRAEKFSRKVRVSMYGLVRSFLPIVGPSMTKQTVSSLTELFRTCCVDLLPPVDDSSSSAGLSTDAKGKSKANQVTVNADSFLNSGKQGRQAKQGPSFPELKRAASELLPVILTYVPTELLAPSLRAEIDRTIILTADKNAMLSSVLNPLPAVRGRGAGSSIIPFLARSYADEMEVESLVRPRMPVLMSTPDMNGTVVVDDDEDEDEDMSRPGYQPTSQSTGFLRTSPPPAAAISNTQAASVETSQTPTPAPAPAPSLNKRVYEEPTPQAPVAQPAEMKEDAQVKRARFEKDTSAASAPAQPSLAKESPATFTGTPAIPVEQSSVTNASAPQPVQTATSSPKPVPATNPDVKTPAAGEEESDDEMPTLNLESDTDDEDEEMDG